MKSIKSKVASNITLESTIDELMFRLNAVIESLGYQLYLSEESDKFIKYLESESGGDKFYEGLSYILFQYALVQLHSIFDRSGVYSFRFNNDFLVSLDRVQKMFPTLSQTAVKNLHIDLNTIFAKYRYEIKTTKSIRGDLIAHTSSRRTDVIEDLDWDGIMNYHILAIPKKLKSRRIVRMCIEIKNTITNYW